MTVGSPPSQNPANLDTLVGMLRTSFTKLMQSVSGMLPAEVISFDRAKNRVSVKPLITVLDTKGNQIPRAVLKNIPVMNSGGGGFILSFNLNPGDLGWIIANDRDISLFLQKYKESKPNTYRIKDVGDSIFLPNPMTGYTISSDDANNAVLQSLDGTVKVSLSSDTVKVVAPNVIIQGNVTVSPGKTVTINGTQVNINASVSATITSPIVNINGTTTLGVGGLPIARAGDPVSVDPVTHMGTIMTGGLNKSL